jgi:HSP20 family protein
MFTEDNIMANATEIAKASHNGGTSADSRRHAAASESVLRPPVDIFETGEGITLHADMPGVAKDRLNLRVEGNSLLIEGTIGVAPQEQMTALHADVRSTVYRRSFTLSHELETQKIEAALKDGELIVRIPKRAELRPRTIAISG